ncbi:MAG TPA: Smr/MutS family protein [Patescibacteria group bacterium]|nr:Smr/MutS family protein [Patescibacteria group bacterium]
MDKKSQRTLEFDKIRERLAQYTSFSAGEDLARKITPSPDLQEVLRWQIETQEARDLFGTNANVTIGGARDVRRLAANAERGFFLQAEDLLNVRSTILAARELRRKLLKVKESTPLLAEIAQLIEECPGLVSAIGNTFDERGVVLDSASPKLGNIRRELRIVHGRIQEKLRLLIGSSNNQYLQEPTITTRNGRYVVPLMANHKGKIKGIVHDQSNSGATLWIEPFNTVELNNEYRGNQLAEEEEIRRILTELTALVAIQADAIIRIVERLSELDLIFARARYADVLRASMPELIPWRPPASTSKTEISVLETEGQAVGDSLHPGSVIWVRGARHPLLDPESVIPTDLQLENDVFVVLITGPNTGGKTVSLKTIGLMVLMAQSGLHLPVIDARLTVFDNVFADIGDEQSIEQNLSTFSGHLANITRILGHVDDRSLVLLDELGAGTDPTEGAALAQSITSYLRDKGATTFIATHFPELKVYASQTPGATNASLLFDVETLMPTFEMSIGMPGRSNAFAIARRLGLDDSILDEAIQLIGANNNKAASLLDSIYDMRELISSQEAGTRLALQQANNERDTLRERLLGIESERAEILASAHQQAENELEEVQSELRQVRRRLRDATSLNRLKELQKQTVEVEEEMIASMKTTSPAIELPVKARTKPAVLQVGDTVLVSTLGVKGNIVGLSGKEAEIVVGRLHMRARLDELQFKDRKDNKEVEESENPTPIHWFQKESPGMELDLRGKRAEDGLRLLDRYLDSAFLARLPWVRIIHGKGTGRLREVVREALDQNSHISSWEEGLDGEGGPGVTVAKFYGD